MDNQDAIEFTVGKIDAGMAVLLTQDNQVIEFPSVLLPEQVVSGRVFRPAIVYTDQVRTPRAITASAENILGDTNVGGVGI
ncbi:Chitin biosynthesis protein CHS5 [Zancudomyces culisetae]|uniref:Chitin biosynthesis protein CHS5 n=1 Tax=Zancudomyces culisetae TaxID=1213189 RepID=A0A1R1PPK2_ZANCU|nr:Chitin biosynthesis protein CHS5 [Zancudomyces culisetae]|eukprot:OMH82888.1 Chitin biosynthesis protein CHS5 [Zancudomyces culisetae]